MSLSINELPAFMLVKEMLPDVYERLLGNDEPHDKPTSLAEYMQMPQELQQALGYVSCVLESTYGRSYCAYGRFSMELLTRMRMWLPIHFIGWAGARNDIGFAYAIDPASLCSPRSRFFYLDSETANHPESAKYLVEAIAQQSTGIDAVRLEKLEELHTLNGVEGGPIIGITFCFSKEKRRTIMINGKEMDQSDYGAAILVVPKDGEFRCKLGEVVDGNVKDCVILAKHTYYLK